jgi:hypothetical protein
MEVGKVYTLKLNSGEEVIAKVLEVNDRTVIITDPVSIAQGPKGMTLIPSMFTAEPGNATLNISSISLYAITEDSIQLKYIEATTGISIPDKKIILG